MLMLIYLNEFPIGDGHHHSSNWISFHRKILSSLFHTLGKRIAPLLLRFNIRMGIDSHVWSSQVRHQTEFIFTCILIGIMNWNLMDLIDSLSFSYFPNDYYCCIARNCSKAQATPSIMLSRYRSFFLRLKIDNKQFCVLDFFSTRHCMKNSSNASMSKQFGQPSYQKQKTPWTKLCKLEMYVCTAVHQQIWLWRCILRYCFIKTKCSHRVQGNHLKC